MRYGYFSNLSADQIAYATQSSEGAFIVSEGREDEVAVEILQENFQHCDEKMYVAIKERKLSEIISGPLEKGPKILKNLTIEFEVKHFYFDGLVRAINVIRPEIIARIMPSSRDFLPLSTTSSYCVHQLLSQIPRDFEINLHDQLQALNTILSSDSRSPPVIVNGSFGTGKTRLLAIATRCLVEQGRSSKKPVRVLICAHHQSSADHYIEQYFGPMTKDEHHPWRVKLIRLISNRHNNMRSLFKWCYKKRDEYLHLYKHDLPEYFVVVSTFSTAGLLLQPGLFTHILLDEGSQTREPENIAPLCLAAPDTKIVIAGDSCQVS